MATRSAGAIRSSRCRCGHNGRCCPSASAPRRRRLGRVLMPWACRHGDNRKRVIKSTDQVPSLRAFATSGVILPCGSSAARACSHSSKAFQSSRCERDALLSSSKILRPLSPRPTQTWESRTRIFGLRHSIKRDIELLRRQRALAQPVRDQGDAQAPAAKFLQPAHDVDEQQRGAQIDRRRHHRNQQYIGTPREALELVRTQPRRRVDQQHLGVRWNAQQPASAETMRGGRCWRARAPAPDARRAGRTRPAKDPADRNRPAWCMCRAAQSSRPAWSSTSSCHSRLCGWPRVSGTSPSPKWALRLLRESTLFPLDIYARSGTAAG